MSTKEIFDDYIITKDGKPIESDYYTVHKRNIEGFEMQFLRFLPKDTSVRILDIGCGCGQLLYMFKQKGYERIEGVDIGAQQVEITRNLGIRAEHITDLKEFLENHTNSWDLITMSQLIEHFPKDKMLSYLRAIRGALSERGSVIIVTPNMALATGLVQRYTDFTHEVGFTERSLGQVLRVAGFSDVSLYGEKLEFRFRPKYLVWWALRNAWFSLLGFVYLLEKGVDRPSIISRHLIAVAKK